MRARVASDHAASIRVLEKCQFKVINETRSFANARGTEINELEMELAVREHKLLLLSQKLSVSE